MSNSREELVEPSTVPESAAGNGAGIQGTGFDGPHAYSKGTSGMALTICAADIADS